MHKDYVTGTHHGRRQECLVVVRIRLGHSDKNVIRCSERACTGYESGRRGTVVGGHNIDNVFNIRNIECT